MKMNTIKVTPGEVTYLVDFLNQLLEDVDVPEHIRDEAEQAGEMLEGWLEDVKRQEEIDLEDDRDE